MSEWFATYAVVWFTSKRFQGTFPNVTKIFVKSSNGLFVKNVLKDLITFPMKNPLKNITLQLIIRLTRPQKNRFKHRYRSCPNRWSQVQVLCFDPPPEVHPNGQFDNQIQNRSGLFNRRPHPRFIVQMCPNIPAWVPASKPVLQGLWFVVQHLQFKLIKVKMDLHLIRLFGWVRSDQWPR